MLSLALQVENCPEGIPKIAHASPWPGSSTAQSKQMSLVTPIRAISLLHALSVSPWPSSDGLLISRVWFETEVLACSRAVLVHRNQLAYELTQLACIFSTWNGW